MNPYHDPAYIGAATEPGVEPSLREAIEAAIDEFRRAHPGVDVQLEFAS